MTPRPRVLLIAEAANPEWVSVPLVGWSHARALAAVAEVHVVTSTRNLAAVERAGWRAGREFTAIDSELLARPIWRFERGLRRLTGLGWTVSTAASALPYYLFEHLVWRRFASALRGGAYDLVHRLTPLSPTIPSLLAARCRRIGVPFVWGPINGGVAWPAAFADVRRQEGDWLSHVRAAHKLLPHYRRTREDAAAIIVGSRATGAALQRYGARCVYIPENAIDPDRFPGQARPADGALRVAFVGRLVPYKGADMLLEAAAPLIRAGKLRLDIIGDGPQMPRLQALASALGLGGGATLDGWVPHDRLQERLSSAQVFAFPSVREFGGGVVLEAMALGLAPVVVDYGGPGELVTEQTGIRVPMGPRPAVILGVRAALAGLCTDPDRATALGQRARARVQAHFTWAAKARQVLEVYHWALGRRAKPDFGTPFPDHQLTA